MIIGVKKAKNYSASNFHIDLFPEILNFLHIFFIPHAVQSHVFDSEDRLYRANHKLATDPHRHTQTFIHFSFADVEKGKGAVLKRKFLYYQVKVSELLKIDPSDIGASGKEPMRGRELPQVFEAPPILQSISRPPN